MCSHPILNHIHLQTHSLFFFADSSINWYRLLHSQWFLIAGVPIFRDDRSVEPGDHVESEVRKAISNSGVYILVISSDHVSPVFLDELVLMVQQRKASDHLLLPIFYHVHPSVAVKFQTGPFSQAFLDLNQELEVSRNQRNEAIILAGDPRGLFPFHLSDDAVATLQEHLLQKASRHKKEMEDISQQLFKWKEALHVIAGLKPVHVDVDSSEYSNEIKNTTSHGIMHTTLCPLAVRFFSSTNHETICPKDFSLSGSPSQCSIYHESEAVKLIVGRVVKHITTKQSLLKALSGTSQ